MRGAEEFVGAACTAWPAVAGCKIMTKDICARYLVLLNYYSRALGCRKVDA
jgi:hypothetical protein